MSDELPYTVGSKPNTVRIYRRSGRKNIYIRTWNAAKGGWDKRSLGHADLERAKAQAAELHAKLVAGEKEQQGRKLTVGRLFALYQQHKTPSKGEQAQGADERRVKLWTRVLGADTAVLNISTQAWERFKARRFSGQIDARGRPVPETDRTPVGARAVEADCRWLKSVCKWGANEWRTDSGYLLSENPVRGDAFKVPTEDNPTRIAASEDRYQRTLAVAGKVHPYLPTLLTLANETGRRIGAIRHLRHSDLLADEGQYGKFRWRAEHDKMEHDSVTVLSREARKALDRHRERFPGVGWLFPHPEKDGEPITRWYPNKWLEAAEEAAGLEPLDGKLWHAYRAKFATDLLDAGVSPVHVARLGGWKSVETVLEIYGNPTDDMLQRALERRHAEEEADPVEEAAALLDVSPGVLSEALRALTAEEQEVA